MPLDLTFFLFVNRNQRHKGGLILQNQTKTQRERFEETARELECDENEDRFNTTLIQIAKGGKKKDDEQPPKD